MSREEIFKVSYSKVNLYQRCPYAYHLRYNRKLQPKTISKSLYFGSDMHKLLQYRGDNEALHKAMDELTVVYDNQSDRNKKTLGEDYIKNLKMIFNDYTKVWKEEPIPDKTEFEFNLDIGETLDGRKLVFNGFIDGLFLDDTKKASDSMVIEEHKTFSTKSPDIVWTLSSQKYLYAKALEELAGFSPQGITWDFIKNTPAPEPTPLKSGKLSESKSAGVTPMSWTRACKRIGESRETIKRGRELYKNNVEKYFYKIYQPIERETTQKVFDDFKTTALFIAENDGIPGVKHCSKDCSWCDMVHICKAEYQQRDVDRVIKDYYTEG